MTSTDTAAHAQQATQEVTVNRVCMNLLIACVSIASKLGLGIKTKNKKDNIKISRSKLYRMWQTSWNINGRWSGVRAKKHTFWRLRRIRKPSTMSVATLSQSAELRCIEAHSSLGPWHTKRPSVGFRAAHQRRYKILLLRPVCGVCAARQLVLISAAWRQKHASRGIELVLILTSDAWYWPIRARAGGSYSGLMSKHQNSLISTRTFI